MPFPIQISPSPIITATTELRILSELPSEKIFPKVYSILRESFPEILPTQTIPKELIVKPEFEQLKYYPQYIITNSVYNIGISSNVLTFSNVGEYTLWKNYFSMLKEVFNQVFSLSYIKQIERIGVRYASLFSNVLNISEIIKKIPTIEINDYNQNFTHFRTDLKKGEYNFHLQLFNNAKVAKNESIVSGSIVDIDASFTQQITANDFVFNIVKELHDEEKNIFFGELIKADFLETLNPQY